MSRKQRLLSGDGRWMIPKPSGYAGKTYIKGLYVYEHRYVMAQKLGRPLLPSEDVHHINGDKLDNCPDNLGLMSHAEHATEHGRSRPKTMVVLVCANCGIRFEREAHNVNYKRKCGQQKFFCSRECWYESMRLPG